MRRRELQAEADVSRMTSPTMTRGSIRRWKKNWVIDRGQIWYVWPL